MGALRTEDGGRPITPPSTEAPKAGPIVVRGAKPGDVVAIDCRPL